MPELNIKFLVSELLSQLGRLDPQQRSEQLDFIINTMIDYKKKLLGGLVKGAFNV